MPELATKITDAAKPEVSRKLRVVLADTFTFIRSREANREAATVTFEQLMGDQIKRNGDTDQANASQYDPYRYDPSKPAPEGVEPAKRANFLGGTDTNRPTKIEMIRAMQNEIEGVVEEVKKLGVITVSNYAEYANENAPESPAVVEE